MTRIRWEPLREITTLQRDLNRLLDDLAAPNREVTALVPPAEIEETAEAYHLRFELPGINPEELDIQATSEALSVNGERQNRIRSESSGVTRSEFRYGKFQRVIPLPGQIETQAIEAHYDAGILTVILPKAEKERSRVVKVAVKSLSPSETHQAQV